MRVAIAFDTRGLSILVENPSYGHTSNGTGTGVGLKGMVERASAVGGALQARRDNNHFVVQATLPYLQVQRS